MWPALIGIAVKFLIWWHDKTQRLIGRKEAEVDALKKIVETERKTQDALNKAPASPSAVAEWLRRGGRRN